MRRKAISSWLILLLIGTIFTVVFVGNVSALNDDQNLSGLIWKSDGSAPGTNTNFCIWVNHLGTWNRFPSTGWASTNTSDDGFTWYAFVLPDSDRVSKWDDGDIYRVQVDGSPWGEFNGNATSNGTGSSGDPFPTPYDPTIESNKDNNINYLAGGGFENEQQWDVRTVAPIDLVPTNITVNGLVPDPAGIPVGPNENVTIIFNVTNFGLVGTGVPFDATVWECLSDGTPDVFIQDFLNLGPLAEYGNLTVAYDTGMLELVWQAPTAPGDYYVNITVDSGYILPESEEDNNHYILYFKIGPDLIVTNVYVDFLSPTDPIYIGPGEVARIDANAMNVGNSPTGFGFDMAMYNITGPNGPIMPGPGQIFYNFISNSLDVGGTTPQQTWNWTAPPDAGDYYVNISVDYAKQIPEGNENNNSITLHFFVGPDLVPNNVTVDGVPYIGQVVVTPQQIVTIGVNASNIGPTSTGVYQLRISYTNCSASGDTGVNSSFFTSGFVGPVDVDGFSEDVYGQWKMPFSTVVFDYYVNITIDYINDVSETNEGNNYFILHFRMDAPDLTFLEVSLEVAGTNVTSYTTIPPLVSAEEEVPLGEDVIIWITVVNDGGVDVTEFTNVTFYNVSGVNGDPIDNPFWEETLLPLNAGETTVISGLWLGPPSTGIYYVNISIDWNGTLDIGGKIIELNESNNAFTLIINVTPLPITRLRRTSPSFPTDASWIYINSSTELYFDPSGGIPPYFTWYRIVWTSNGTEVKPWTNYTDEGGMNFKMEWGEGTFTIYFNTTDSVSAQELTKSKIVIVDDSPPQTNIIIGDPQYRADVSHFLNITSSTPIDLSAFDDPPGVSPAGPGILNAAGINGIDDSGMFYIIQNLSSGSYVTDWLEYSSGSPFYLDDPTWGDGYYMIWFNSTDNLGQKETSDSMEIYLDNTGPDTMIDVGDPKHPHPNSSYNSFVTSATPFTLSAFEAIGSGVNASSIQFQITFEGTITPGWVYSNVFEIISYFIQRDGNYSIQFKSKDNLGNFGPTGSILVYVDDTPPTTTLTIGQPQYKALTNHTLNITSATPLGLPAGDGTGCGLNYTHYRIYNLTFDTGWIDYTVEFTFSENWSDGIYNIEYYSVDFLGNTELSRNYTINLDNTPPDTLLYIDVPKYRVNDPSDMWNITSLTNLSLSADDGLGSGVGLTRYRIYDTIFDTGWVNYSIEFTISSDWDDGIYTIEYGSMDNLGNERIEQANVYLDNNGPITTIDWPHTQDDWNEVQNAWNINFSTFFTLNADDGMGSGVEHIEYSITREDGTWTPWQTFTGQPFNLTLDEHGSWRHTIQFRSFDNLGNLGPTDNLYVYIEGDMTPPLPPVLKLRISEDDIILDWTPSPDLDINYYLIYRSTTKTGFDFDTIWVNTLIDMEPGETNPIPLRTTWNDTGAVSGSTEYYYCIRGVDIRDNRGYTSNIAGKVTMTFEEGYNDFSMPLKPFEDFTASEMLSNDVFSNDADTIYRYDNGFQQWMGHPKFLPETIDDFTLNLGEGYMILILEDNMQYTFVGSTGTAIRFKGGLGDDTAFRDSLEADIEGNDIKLTWQSIEVATGYAVYRATERIGDNSLTNYSIEPIEEFTEDTNWTDQNADGDEYYYLVVALNDEGEQSSTYAIGIKKYHFDQGYSVFSFELEPKASKTLSWFTNEMFTLNTDTLFYYDKTAGSWNGHPMFLPENINNIEVNIGRAYIAYIHDDQISYSFIGI